MGETVGILKPNWLPMMLGSVPHLNASTVWHLVKECFPEIPCWPQFPRRDFAENMYVQFSERFPGIILQNERIHVDRRGDLDSGLEQLYLAYLEDDLAYGRMGRSYAAGLDALLSGELDLPEQRIALKGQITGPVSWGLTVVDQNQRPILYDEVLADAVGKHLRLKAAWQERKLAALGPRVVTMIDEPYMASFGSAFVALGRDQVTGLLEEVFAGLQGIKGVHCCGNTDWSILLSTSLDVLSLDAYDYAQSLALYPEDVSQFLGRGGTIAWGIVPAGIAAEAETAESLVERLHQAMQLLVDKGVSLDAILKAGMVTPSCGLGSLTPSLAERVLKMTRQVSNEMRRRYVPDSQVTA